MKLADYYQKNRDKILMKARLYRLREREKIRRKRIKYNRLVKAGVIRQRKRKNVGRSYVDMGYQ